MRAARVMSLRVRVEDLTEKGHNLFASSQLWRERFVQERSKNRLTRHEFAAVEAKRLQKIVDAEPRTDRGPYAFNWAEWSKGYIGVLREVERQ